MSSKPSFIFHHKNVSPYSEKIRLMLGYSNMPWLSIQAPLTPPRPSIDPLVGGYRRIPVAQIGADVFCDTRIIADEVSLIAGQSELSPYSQSTKNGLWSERIETEMFATAMNCLSPIGLVRALLTQVPLRKIPNYLADKKHLFRHGNPEFFAELPDRKECKTHWLQHLDALEMHLSDDFLTGNAPVYLDFCAIHLLWFRMGMEGMVLFFNRPNLAKWYQRMTDFSHGNPIEGNASDAIESARKTSPRPIDSSMLHGKDIGSYVSVATTDVLLGDTKGHLVGESETRWILARETQNADLVHVHFPKSTYRITFL